MLITLENNKEKFCLTLGASWLNLTLEAAIQLQTSLENLQPTAWQLNSNSWQKAKQELATLPSLLEQLLNLGKNLQNQALSSLELNDSLALARYSQLEAEALSSKLIKQLKKSLTTKNLKAEFTEELNSQNKSSALAVAAAKNKLLMAFKELSIKPKLNAATQQLPSNQPTNEEIQAKAKNYLAYLAKIPAAQIKIILKNLVPAEIGWLVSACKTLGVEEFNQKLAKILPAASWEKLDANCPAEITNAKLNQLSASLGLAFKELQQRLQQKGE